MPQFDILGRSQPSVVTTRLHGAEDERARDEMLAYNATSETGHQSMVARSSIDARAIA
jgi:hypothetical protein